MSQFSHENFYNVIIYQTVLCLQLLSGQKTKYEWVFCFYKDLTIKNLEHLDLFSYWHREEFCKYHGGFKTLSIWTVYISFYLAIN